MQAWENLDAERADFAKLEEAEKRAAAVIAASKVARKALRDIAKKFRAMSHGRGMSSYVGVAVVGERKTDLDLIECLDEAAARRPKALEAMLSNEFRLLVPSYVELEAAMRAAGEDTSALAEARRVLTHVIERAMHSNRKFVHARAKRMTTVKLGFAPIEDMEQEGMLAIAHAVSKFRGEVKFLTYAEAWIRQRMSRYGDTQRTVGLSYDMIMKRHRVMKLRDDHVARFGESPSLEELATLARLPVKKTKELLDLETRTLYLDEHVPGFDGDATYLDTIEDPHTVNPLDTLASARVRGDLEKAMKHLTPREKFVLQHRFGFGVKCEDTLEAIGEKLGVTRERVRQLETAALKKVRRRIRYMGKQANSLREAA